MVMPVIDLQVDSQKCASPNECRVCLDRCPQSVFQIYPANGRRPDLATTEWAIQPLFLSLCTACGICRDTCPQHAISIVVT